MFFVIVYLLKRCLHTNKAVVLNFVPNCVVVRCHIHRRIPRLIKFFDIFSLFMYFFAQMSSTDTAGRKPSSLAQRILELQARNRKQLHVYEASRTSQS